MRGNTKDWVLRWTAITAAVAWLLANAVDVFSLLFVVQMGEQLAFAAHRPAEWLVIYAGMRMLGTLACALVVVWVSKQWPSSAKVAWGALIACSLLTAAFAWLRLSA